MKHVSILFRSKCWNVFLLLCIALPSLAQKEFKIDQVSVVNVGDGRFLYRDLMTENRSTANIVSLTVITLRIYWPLLKMVFMMANMKSIWITF